MRTVASRGFAREFVCPLTPSPLQFTMQDDICIEPKTRHGLGFREMALDKAPRSKEGTAPPIKAEYQGGDSCSDIFFAGVSLQGC